MIGTDALVLGLDLGIVIGNQNREDWGLGIGDQD